MGFREKRASRECSSVQTSINLELSKNTTFLLVIHHYALYTKPSLSEYISFKDIIRLFVEKIFREYYFQIGFPGK